MFQIRKLRNSFTKFQSNSGDHNDLELLCLDDLLNRSNSEKCYSVSKKLKFNNQQLIQTNSIEKVVNFFFFNLKILRI